MPEQNPDSFAIPQDRLRFIFGDALECLNSFENLNKDLTDRKDLKNALALGSLSLGETLMAMSALEKLNQIPLSLEDSEKWLSNLFNTRTIKGQLCCAHRDQLQADPAYKKAYQAYQDRQQEYHDLTPLERENWNREGVKEALAQVHKGFDQLWVLFKQPVLQPAPEL